MFDTTKMSAADALFEAQKISFAPIIFQCARLLCEWGIFELLQKNKMGLNVEDISQKLNVTPYSIRILCESGFSMGALKLEDEIYTITRIGYFLLNDEMTKINMDFNHDVNYQGLFYLDEALKNDRPFGLHKIFSNEKTKFCILYRKRRKICQKKKDEMFC